jgi:hypothetical protein
MLKETDRAEPDLLFSTLEQQMDHDGNGQGRHSRKHQRVGKKQAEHG